MTTTNFVYPKNAREIPRRDSPLVNGMVAPGHTYDKRTGLVQPDWKTLTVNQDSASSLGHPSK